MKSTYGFLTRLLSGSGSGSSSSKGRDHAGSSNCDVSVSSSGAGPLAALAATLSLGGDRQGLTLADVTGRLPAQEEDEGPVGMLAAAIEESGSPPKRVSMSTGGAASSSAVAGPPSAAGETAVAVPMEEAAPDGEEAPPLLRMATTMSISFRPLEEDPEWALFLPFDALEFSFVGGSIGATRPIPEEFKPIAHATLTMVVPVIQNVTRIRRIVVGEKKPGEAFLVDTPLATKSTQPAASPVDDLRLADQMLRLALVGKPHGYSYWHFQFFVAADVNRILGRGAYGGEMESDLILHKIEGLTGTRVLVAPHDPASWRRCFMLLGEQELIDRAVQLLSGAITQGMAPTREGVRQVLALHQDPNAPLLEDDPRLEEIRKELKGVHGLRMVEVQRDGNCAFRALARFEYKTEARHREIRRLVCERLKEAPGAMEVTALVEGVTVEEYLDRMARDTTWGGYTEIMAYAEALGRNVRLFVENDKIGIRPTVIEQHRGPGEPRTVQLLLYRSHYWLLL